MTKTVAELFSPEDGCAFVPLLWGGRKESPAEVAARAAATMSILAEAAAAHFDDDPIWMRLSDDGLGYTPARSDTDGLASLATGGTGGDINKDSTERTTLQLMLFQGKTDTTLLASFGLSAGLEQTSLGNSCTVVLEQRYPLESADAAARLFTELVHIWQPESAILSTDRTIAEVNDLYDTYAGYASWIASGTFGLPPHLESASAETCGEGTLLTVKDWSVDGVRRMHQELLAAGVPSLTSTVDAR